MYCMNPFNLCFQLKKCKNRIAFYMYMYQYLESYKQVAKPCQFQITERDNHYMYILSKKT